MVKIEKGLILRWASWLVQVVQNTVNELYQRSDLQCKTGSSVSIFPKLLVSKLRKFITLSITLNFRHMKIADIKRYQLIFIINWHSVHMLSIAN